MTKLAKVGTIEHGLRQSLEMLGAEGASAAIRDVVGVNRSVSLIRKCADPDNSVHHLQLRYAVAIDAHCVAQAGSSPILDMYGFLLEKLSKSHEMPTSDGRMWHSVLQLQSALGELSHAVSDGLSADGHGGSELTNTERHAIFEALEDLEQQSDQIKRAITL